MRLDKWLWVARFFKTRALAARACDLGRVAVAGQPAKPARELRGGEQLHIVTEGGDFEVTVLALSEVRGPARTAQTLYQESDASRAARQRAQAEHHAQFAGASAPAGRPGKRDRRRIRQFRGEEK
ncbi:MAG: RNA-binding S4 domain-containing protein [Terriglobales bacterium]